MSDVVGQDWRPTHLVSQASISFPYPVLVSGLKCNGTEGLVLLGATTRRLELKPKGNMAIANVISYVDTHTLLLIALPVLFASRSSNSVSSSTHPLYYSQQFVV